MGELGILRTFAGLTSPYVRVCQGVHAARRSTGRNEELGDGRCQHHNTNADYLGKSMRRCTPKAIGVDGSEYNMRLVLCHVEHRIRHSFAG